MHYRHAVKSGQITGLTGLCLAVSLLLITPGPTWVWAQEDPPTPTDTATPTPTETPTPIPCDSPTRYWVGGGGSWTDSAHWSCTSGGPGGAGVPVCVSVGNAYQGTNDCVWDGNSGLAPDAGVIESTGLCCHDADSSGVLPWEGVLPGTFSDGFYVSGSLTTGYGMGMGTLAGPMVLTATDETHTVQIFSLTFNGATSGFDFHGSGTYGDHAIWDLTTDLPAGNGPVILGYGTLRLHGHRVDAWDVLSGHGTNPADAFTLDEGDPLPPPSGPPEVAVWHSWSIPHTTFVPGNVFFYGIGDGARTFNGGDLSYLQVRTDLFEGGQWNVTGNAVIERLTLFTVPCASSPACGVPPEHWTTPVTIVEAGTTQTVTEWNVTGSSDLSLILQSSSPGNPWTLNCTATFSCASNYLILSDSTCSGNIPCYAGTHSTDGGGNTNWIFADAPPTPTPTSPPPPPPGCCAFSGENDFGATCVDNVLLSGDKDNHEWLSVDLCQTLSHLYLGDDPVLYFNPDSNCSPNAGDFTGSCPTPPVPTATATPTTVPETFVVTSTVDASDAVPGDGSCDDGTGQCTLRAAIEEVNHRSGGDTIVFNIDPSTDVGCDSNTQVCTIQLTQGSLPQLSVAVTLDGTTQPGSSCGDLWGGIVPIWNVVIDANDQAGITVGDMGGGSTIRGFKVINANAVGSGGVALNGNGSTVQCNYLWHNYIGIMVHTGTSDLIGGPAPGDGNVAAGNTRTGIGLFDNHADYSIVQGNFVGVDPTGMAADGNGEWGIVVDDASYVLVDHNLSSGNFRYGIVIITPFESYNNVISNNTVGRNRTNTADICNGTENGGGSDENISDDGTGTTLSNNILGCLPPPPLPGCCAFRGDTCPDPDKGICHITCVDGTVVGEQVTSALCDYVSQVYLDNDVVDHFNPEAYCDPTGDVHGVCVPLNAATPTPTETPTPIPCDGSIRYWVGDSGEWSDPAHWSCVSGGAGGAGVPNDATDCIFDAASFSNDANVSTTSLEHIDCADMDWSGIIHDVTLNGPSSSVRVHGSLALSSTLQVFSLIELVGSGTITGNGFLHGSFTVNAPDGTYTIQDDWVGPGVGFSMRAGALDTNSKSLQWSWIGDDTPNSGQNATLHLGSSHIVVNGGFTILYGTHLTVNAGTSLIEARSIGGTVNIVPGHEEKIYYDLKFDHTGLADPEIDFRPDGSYISHQWTIEPGTTVRWEDNSSVRVHTMSCTGDPDHHIQFTALVLHNANSRLITDSQITCDYLDVEKITCDGAVPCLDAPNGIDLGGNENWCFSNCPAGTYTPTPTPTPPGPGCCAFSGTNDFGATCVDNILLSGDKDNHEWLSVDLCQTLSHLYLGDDPVLYFNPDSNCSPEGDLAGTCPPPIPSGCCGFSGNNPFSVTCVDNVLAKGDPLLSYDVCAALAQGLDLGDVYFNPNSNCSPDAADLGGTCPPPEGSPTPTPHTRDSCLPDSNACRVEAYDQCTRCVDAHDNEASPSCATERVCFDQHNCPCTVSAACSALMLAHCVAECHCAPTPTPTSTATFTPTATDTPSPTNTPPPPCTPTEPASTPTPGLGCCAFPPSDIGGATVTCVDSAILGEHDCPQPMTLDVCRLLSDRFLNGEPALYFNPNGTCSPEAIDGSCPPPDAAPTPTPTTTPSTPSFVEFESGQVRPLALSPDSTRLFAVNTPDNRLEIFDILADGGISHGGSVVVGLEPVAVAARSNDEVWVVNHLSDSVSVIDVSATPARVLRTVLVGDEPRDIVFAGTAKNRAFITTAHRGQQRTDPSIAAVPGAGDPQLTTPQVGRADVWVFDAMNLGNTFGGTPLSIVTLFGDTPRALAVTADGGTVYAAVFHSGNRTTTVSVGPVCQDTASCPMSCPDCDEMCRPSLLPLPHQGEQPATGLIAKYNGTHWVDGICAGGTRSGVECRADGDCPGSTCMIRNWDNAVMFTLPDQDVFAIDANASPPAATAASYAGVGTILYNMAVNPVNGKVYVTNTDAQNDVRFEGSGGGGSTVQGHLHEARITVLDGSAVLPRHLNKHIDYSQRPAPAGVKANSLALPVGIAVTSDGTTAYVAALGSNKIGVFATSELEDDTFTPSAASQITLAAGKGPTGLVLDEVHQHLYTLTRFDDGISVIDVDPTSDSYKTEVDHRTLYNPEPAKIVNGRRFLYDAAFASSNGEAACASCHVFGDFDSLAWDIGNPDESVVANPNPLFPGTKRCLLPFHPLKGPMTTQSLRGLAHQGPMHWRGDRTGASDPGGSAFDEAADFKKFNAAFTTLLGRAEQLSSDDMQAFTDFILEVTYPPNPIHNLDNTLTADQAAGRDFFTQADTDGPGPCRICHVIDNNRQLFGTSRGSIMFNEQSFKIPHFRNLYQKVGMFGMPAVHPSGEVNESATLSFKEGNNGPQGDQVRGFGFLNDGSVDTVFRFLNLMTFSRRNGAFQSFAPEGICTAVTHCTVDSDCTENQVCRQKSCVTPCTLPEDCPGQFCQQTGSGTPCPSDHDPSDSGCVCAIPCTDDDDCTGNGVCGGNKSRRQVEAFLLAMDSNLAPIVGQQITLTSANANDAAVAQRIDLIICRATDTASHPCSMDTTGHSPECDVVAKGTVNGEERGWVFDRDLQKFRSDRSSEPLLSDSELRALAATAGQELTYTAVPIGSGQRIGIDRDGDTYLDRDELDTGSDPADASSVPVPTPTP